MWFFPHATQRKKKKKKALWTNVTVSPDSEVTGGGQNNRNNCRELRSVILADITVQLFLPGSKFSFLVPAAPPTID